MWPTENKRAAALERAGLLSRADGYLLTRPELLLPLLVRDADSLDAKTARFANETDEFIRVNS